MESVINSSIKSLHQAWLFNESSRINTWEHPTMHHYRYIIFTALFVVSLIGNVIVSVSILLLNGLRHVTNYFLLNMVVADVLVTIFCMPIHLISWEDPSVMTNQLICKTMPFIQGTCLCCVINTLVVIAIDRYVVISRPFGQRIRPNHCIPIIACIWIISILVVSPCLFVYRVEFDAYHNCYRCDEFGWSKQHRIVYTFTLAVLLYLLPLIIFVVLYSKMLTCLWFRKIPGLKNLPVATQKILTKKLIRRKKLVRILLVTVLSFMISQLPQQIVNFLWYMQGVMNWSPPTYMPVISFHAELILYANNAINPMVYGCLQGKTKQVLCHILQCCKKSDKESRFLATNPGTNKKMNLKESCLPYRSKKRQCSVHSICKKVEGVSTFNL